MIKSKIEIQYESPQDEIQKDRKLQQSEHCKFVKTQVGLQSSKFNIQGSSSIFNIQVQYSNLKLSRSSKFGKLRKPRNSERSQNLESQDKYKRSGINAACTFFFGRNVGQPVNLWYGAFSRESWQRTLTEPCTQLATAAYICCVAPINVAQYGKYEIRRVRPQLTTRWMTSFWESS